MTELNQYKQMDYERLLPFFEKMIFTDHDLTCAEIARQTKISHAQVVKYFSRYLVELKHHKETEEQRCPSCGRLKHEVTDPAVCRDIIHYL